MNNAKLKERLSDWSTLGNQAQLCTNSINDIEAQIAAIKASAFPECKEMESLLHSEQKRLSQICVEQLFLQRMVYSCKDTTMRELLTKRYKENKPWRVVATELGISISLAFKLHRDALNLLSKNNNF